MNSCLIEKLQFLNPAINKLKNIKFFTINSYKFVYYEHHIRFDKNLLSIINVPFDNNYFKKTGRNYIKDDNNKIIYYISEETKNIILNIYRDISYIIFNDNKIICNQQIKSGNAIIKYKNKSIIVSNDNIIIKQFIKYPNDNILLSSFDLEQFNDIRTVSNYIDLDHYFHSTKINYKNNSNIFDNILDKIKDLGQTIIKYNEEEIIGIIESIL